MRFNGQVYGAKALLGILISFSVTGHLSGCSHAKALRASGTEGAQSPGTYERAYQKGMQAINQGKFEEARSFLREALAFEPENPLLLSNLSLVEDLVNRRDEAVAHAAKAATLAPHSAAIAVNRGLILEGHGKLPEALSEYRRALELKPRFAPALLALGGYFLRAGDIDEAARQFELAARVNATQPDAFAGLAAVAAAQKRWRAAARAMDEARRRAPESAIYASAAGALWMRAGAPEPAKAALTEALTKSPMLTDALVLRAELAWREQDYAVARDLYQRAVTLDTPGLFRAAGLLRQGELSLTLERPDLAQAALRLALRQANVPEAWRGEAHSLLGVMAVRRQDWAAAKNEFDLAHAVLGDTPLILAGRAAALHGAAATVPVDRRASVLASVEPLYRQAIDADSAPDMRVAFGRLYSEWADVVIAPLRRAKLRLAERQFRAALVSRPGYVEAHARLAMLLETLERRGEARDSWDTAVALDPQSSRLHFLRADFLRREAARAKDDAMQAAAHEGYAAAMHLDQHYQPAQIGWYLTAATATTQEGEAELYGEPSSDSVPPSLEDLLPFLERPEPEDDEALKPDIVIPIKQESN